jgi:hypothetical protein
MSRDNSKELALEVRALPRLQHDAAVARGAEAGGRSVVLDASAIAACALGSGGARRNYTDGVGNEIGDCSRW